MAESEPWRSAPDDPAADGAILGTRKELLAAIRLQAEQRGRVARASQPAAPAPPPPAEEPQDSEPQELDEEQLKELARKQQQLDLELEERRQRRQQEREAEEKAKEAGASSSADDASQLEELPFVVRNLDTGEFVELPISKEQGASARFGFAAVPMDTLPGNEAAAELLRVDCRGMLEKLAASSSLSFRAYQLCVWQERYVFAEEDALCYQHLSADLKPVGTPKRIAYASIEFIGPFDETQFVLKCVSRNYTFLCDSADARTRWIKNVARLAGCSCSTEVCFKTKQLCS